MERTKITSLITSLLIFIPDLDTITINSFVDMYLNCSDMIDYVLDTIKKLGIQKLFESVISTLFLLKLLMSNKQIDKSVLTDYKKKSITLLKYIKNGIINFQYNTLHIDTINKTIENEIEPLGKKIHTFLNVNSKLPQLRTNR